MSDDVQQEQIGESSSMDHDVSHRRGHHQRVRRWYDHDAMTLADGF